MHNWAKDLFPICRSLTGNGFLASLDILSKHIDLSILEFETGQKCYQWEIPEEWNIKDAYIVTPAGDKIAEFKKNNLHVVGYSDPVDKIISLVAKLSFT